MTGGNKFHENTNRIVHNQINSIQGNLRISMDIKSKMKNTANRLFDEFKDNKQKYMDTLLTGEEKGFCKGIKARLDPTMKYKQLQKTIKDKLKREEWIVTIKKAKEINDKRKIKAKKMRV